MSWERLPVPRNTSIRTLYLPGKIPRELARISTLQAASSSHPLAVIVIRAAFQISPGLYLSG
jgi:hypothetical protein